MKNKQLTQINQLTKKIATEAITQQLSRQQVPATDAILKMARKSATEIIKSIPKMK